MILSRRKHRQNTYCLIFFGCLLGGMGGLFLSHTIPFLKEYIKQITVLLFLMGSMGYMAYALYLSFTHKLWKGLKYAVKHKRLMNRIEQELLDAHHYVERYSGMTKVAILPRIRVDFNKDLMQGSVRIRNHLKYHKKLEGIDISSALSEYIVDNAYISNDENWFVFEFISSKLNNKLVFHSIDEFRQYASKCDCYHYFFDGRTDNIDLCSFLIAGLTGSGKTYAVYTLILESLLWKIPPVLYFCDPKNSSLSALGQAIAPERTAETVEGIIELLREFVSEMEVRKRELKEKLYSKLESTAKDFSFPAYILYIDEFSSFISIVNTMDKKTRDEVNSMLRSIVLQGRQLNFHICIIMQKSDSTDIPTAIRSNLICKLVLGQANRTVYQTAFELASEDIPERKFSAGEGLMTYQGITRNTPRVISFPYLDFNILQSARDIVKELPSSKTGVPQKNKNQKRSDKDSDKISECRNRSGNCDTCSEEKS